MPEPRVFPASRSDEDNLVCLAISNCQYDTSTITYIREEFPINLLIVVQVHVIPCMTEENDQQNIIEGVVSSGVNIVRRTRRGLPGAGNF